MLHGLQNATSLLGRARPAFLHSGLGLIIHSGCMDQAPARGGEPAKPGSSCLPGAAHTGGAGQVHTDGGQAAEGREQAGAGKGSSEAVGGPLSPGGHSSGGHSTGQGSGRGQGVPFDLQRGRVGVGGGRPGGRSHSETRGALVKDVPGARAQSPRRWAAGGGLPTQAGLALGLRTRALLGRGGGMFPATATSLFRH